MGCTLIVVMKVLSMAQRHALGRSPHNAQSQKQFLLYVVKGKDQQPLLEAKFVKKLLEVRRGVPSRP